MSQTVQTRPVHHQQKIFHVDFVKRGRLWMSDSDS